MCRFTIVVRLEGYTKATESRRIYEEEALREAYVCKNESDMIGHLNTVLALCRETKKQEISGWSRISAGWNRKAAIELRR